MGHQRGFEIPMKVYATIPLAYGGRDYDPGAELPIIGEEADRMIRVGRGTNEAPRVIAPVVALAPVEASEVAPKAKPKKAAPKAE